MNKRAIPAFLLGLASLPAGAHIYYHEIPLHLNGATITGSLDQDVGNSDQDDWAFAAKWPVLKDLMTYHGQPQFFRFHLDQDAIVNIDALPVAAPQDTGDPKNRSTWAPANVDPAFSLYKGLLPQKAMDSGDQPYYACFDPVTAWGMPLICPMDAHPDDPNIAQVWYVNINPDGSPVIDPTYGQPTIDPVSFLMPMQVNPDWGMTLGELVASMNADPGNALHPWRNNYNEPHLQNLIQTDGATSVADWYRKSYVPHNGYRDTLNFTATGGVWLPNDPNLPASTQPGFPVNPYIGKFDPLANWESANGNVADCALDDACKKDHPGYDPATMTLCQTTDASAKFYCAGGNAAGVDWARVYYINHANRHDGDATLLPISPASKAAPNTAAERVHNQFLPKGDYTLAFGGGCTDCRTENDTPQGQPGYLPYGYGGVSMSDYSLNNLTVLMNGKANLHFSIQGWPVADCASNTGAKPELAPVSGPWDVEAGAALAIPLGVHYCGSDTPGFKLAGLKDAQLDAPMPDKVVNHAWKSQAIWTSRANQAGKVINATFRVHSGHGDSKIQKLSIRVWPAGAGPSNAFGVKNVKVSWDGQAHNLNLSAQIKPTHANLMSAAEIQSLYGHYLGMTTGSGNMIYSSVDAQGVGSTMQGAMPSDRGKLSFTGKMDISQVPCEIIWIYKGKTGKVKVDSAPANCKK
ncbi:MAG: hypothetical protein PHE55_15990 [Methylococcaceae bacterium]|nr:hypothetical protein [Methylococcaceae bacterium]